VSGTVPVVRGTRRENYLEFVPADSFIHVDDFPDPKSLVKYILELDEDHERYMRSFLWRRHYKVARHLLSVHNAFTKPMWYACDYVSKHKA